MSMSCLPVSSLTISTIGRRRLVRSWSPGFGKRLPIDTSVWIGLEYSVMSSALKAMKSATCLPSTLMMRSVWPCRSVTAFAVPFGMSMRAMAPPSGGQKIQRGERVNADGVEVVGHRDVFVGRAEVVGPRAEDRDRHAGAAEHARVGGRRADREPGDGARRLGHVLAHQREQLVIGRRVVG